MCGNKLAVETPRDLATAVDPVDTPREPPPPEPAAAVAEPAPRSDKWWVDEEPSETTSSGGGLSILGLSSTDSGNGGRHSYLLEEEQPSRTRVWVFLVLVLILGGVLYAKWQPIRDYVLTTAPSQSRPQPQPAQDTKNEPPPTSMPATTLAASDAVPQPALAAESKPEQNEAAQPSQQLPQADPQSSTAGKPDDSPKPTPALASSKRAAEPPSKPAAQIAPAPPGNAGSELVSSGESYLYARGAARNCAQAVSYFNAAAALQNPQAFSHLGALYATGECVPMDRAVAYAWFRRAYAREPGNRYFEQNLIMLWREMTPAERQRTTGRQ